MPNLLKKFTLSILAGLIILFSFAPYLQVGAQATQPTPLAPAQTGTWYNQDFKAWFSKVYDPNVSPDNEIFGERYTAAQVQWVVYGLWALIINVIIPQNLTACLLTNSTNIDTCATVLNQALGKTGALTPYTHPQKQQNLLSLVFATDRPFSGISYVKNTIQNFSLVPTAHAQTAGFGFGALDPIKAMWTASRNISFGLFVIAAIIFAFMIMFRVKISPQVVISIQSAIPKLIIALILVTFSYAIAGFLIDLMYVVIGLVGVFGTGFLPFHPDPTYVFNFLTLGQNSGINVQLNIFLLLGGYLFVFFVGLVALIFVGGGLVGFVNPVTWIYILMAILFIIVAAIVSIWISFKIIWGLIKAFANILLLTIFAPLQLTAGVLVPGLGFGAWVKSFSAALSTFVVTGVLIFFSYIFCINGIVMGVSSLGGGGNLASSLGQILFGNTGAAISQAIQGGSDPRWPPLLGSVGTMQGLLFLAVSFVFFTLIPKATEIIQGFITGRPFAYGTAIGEAINPMGLTGYAAAAGVGKAESRIIQIVGGKDTGLGRATQFISESIQKRLTKP